MSVQLYIHQRVTEKLPGFRLAYLIYEGAITQETPHEKWQEFASLCEHVQENYRLENLTDIPGIKEGRRAFKALGVDPARYRPSSEALLRRVLQNKPLGSVNTAVDGNNYVSIYFGLPFGLYDISALEGNVSCRLGDGGESYLGLNGREVSLEAKLLTADAKGPFGSPVVDSERTSVQPGATRLLHIAYVFPGYTVPQKFLEQVSRQFAQFTAAKTVESGIKSAKSSRYKEGILIS